MREYCALCGTVMPVNGKSYPLKTVIPEGKVVPAAASGELHFQTNAGKEL